MRQILLSFFVIGCAAIGCSRTHVQPTPIQFVEPASPSTPREIGTSVRGRSIAIERFGSGRIGVFILAGIHGDERETVPLAMRFCEYLHDQPNLRDGRTVTIIPIANPDGFAANTRTNANGVDLNRNFPANNFRNASRARRTGSTRPADQPETVALMRAIEEAQPRLIISIHSAHDELVCNNYDGPAESIARVMSKHNGYRVAASMGYPTPGSMGSYYGVDRQIPIITLELPRGASDEHVWESNRDALLAAIRVAH
jgi:murein peptide amidase A